MTVDQLWHATLGELELELSKANFTTWFDNTFILEISNGDITVGVPNAFTKTWLENKYHTSILKALKRISDDDVTRVCYQVTNGKRQATLEQLPAAVVRAEEERSKKPVAYGTVTVAVAPQSVGAHNEEVGLSPGYKFENFIVGKKNELAHAACLAAAERPGLVYNPLFIYGGVGLGKTHLMQAVGHAALERNPQLKVLYVTCETFTNEFIKMVGEGRADEFKEKYRSVDILMVDDVQFLAGKEGTQEAFFHTFNHLHQRNKQVLLTSDRPPRAIPTLEHRLISRFEGGMIVDVSQPDLETRIAILSQKCREKGYELPQEIATFIASNVQNNVRELEGALNRIMAYHELHKEPPTVASVKGLLSTLSHEPKRGAVTTSKIISTVSEFFEVEEKNLMGNSRKKQLVVPRQIAMYLMREEVHASYPNIGQELGGRDHTTAMHACQKIARLVEEDDKLENDIGMIKQRLYN